MIKMENDVLSVEIAEHGAELTKLYNKKTGTDLLWDAEPKFWKRHSPVLFPIVGSVWDSEDQRHTLSDITAWICKRQ